MVLQVFSTILMVISSMNIFFITGTSGSGKSTLIHFLKDKLSEKKFSIHDFDENGVPSNADREWRIKTTEYWITRAEHNATQKKSTIICGVTLPSEVMYVAQKTELSICFGFIKISDNIIKQRLQERKWSEQLIQDNINWAHYLETEVVVQKNHLFVDGSLSPALIANEFIEWILNAH